MGPDIMASLYVPKVFRERCLAPRPPLLFIAAHEGGEIFVLVRRDQIHTCPERSAPAGFHRLARAEIIAFVPALTLRRLESIERVEADPETALMGIIDQGAQAPVAGRGPFAGNRLSALLDRMPG